MTINAGIYNKNEELYKKGFENFKKYTLLQMERFEESTDGQVQAVSIDSGEKEEIKIGEAHRQFCADSKEYFDMYTGLLGNLKKLKYFD